MAHGNGQWWRDQVTVTNVMAVSILVFQIGGFVRANEAATAGQKALEQRVELLEKARTDERARLDPIYMLRELALTQNAEILRRLDAIDRRLSGER